MDTTMTDADRWEMALEAARDDGSPAFAHALRRKNVTMWVVIGVCFVVVGVLSALLVTRFFPDTEPSHDPGAGRVVVGFTLEGLGLALLVVNLVRMVRSGRYRASWRSPTRVLSMSQRRSLLRQVKGSAQVDPALLPLARNLATMLARQSDQAALLISGLVLTQAGGALVEDTTFYLIFVGALVALYLAAIPFTIRQTGRAQAFLRDHPAVEQPA